MNRVD